MRILPCSRDLGAIEKDFGPFAVALGVFDGVHQGHRKLLDLTQSLAKQDGIAGMVYTFDPMPIAVLAPEKAPRLIEPVERRLRRFVEAGVEFLLVERFDEAFAQTDAEEFVEQVLVDHLQARHVVVGESFAFGKGARGNVALLAEMGIVHGFQAHGVEHVTLDGERVSSSRIRSAITDGNVELASRLLGRPPELVGPVVKGAGRGHTIGIPTANIGTLNALLPATGVYAATARLQDESWSAVVNIGYTPTFDSEKEIKVEAHLLDFPGRSLYGERIVVALTHRLRAEKKFDGVDALVAQIHADIARARELF